LVGFKWPNPDPLELEVDVVGVERTPEAVVLDELDEVGVERELDAVLDPEPYPDLELEPDVMVADPEPDPDPLLDPADEMAPEPVSVAVTGHQLTVS
jgi:hypothetical protein